MQIRKMLRRVSVAAALAALLVLVTHWALTSWAESRLDRLEAVWGSEVFRGRSPAEAYPARETNDATREVERLAAQLGILFDRSGFGTSTGEGPGGDSELASAAVSADGHDPLGALFRAGASFLSRAGVAESSDVGPFPAEAAATLDVFAPTLDSLSEILLEERVGWEIDIERGIEMSEVDYSSHRALHKVLVLASWRALASGDTDGARRRLDAASHLRRAIERDPLLIAALVLPGEVAREVPLRLRLCPQPESSSNRYADLDLPALYRRNLRGEAWAVLQSMARAEAISEAVWPVSVLAGTVSRAALVHYAEAVEAGAGALGETPWQTFDADAFFEEQRELIPGWSPFSRVLFVNGYGGWAAAVRTQISLELLAVVDSERKRERSGRAGEETPSEETIASSVDSALSWRVQRGGARTTVSLEDGNGALVSLDGFGSGALGVMTRFELDIDRCAQES